MKRAHRMPFGAQVEPDGTRFRLWSPSASAVALHLEDAGGRRVLPMTNAGEGWFERLVDGVGHGARYAYAFDGREPVADPASRFNPEDVHGRSMVVDPARYTWHDGGWRGRPWHEAVVYELHVGTFTPEGTYEAAIGRLDHLASLGVTVIELMPLADFAGARNWGYDGVLLYAPDASYGTPEELKSLIDAAHARGLAVLLDVVYNHFGPEGNYLPSHTPAFFNPAHHTPWGAAVNYDGDHSRTVRDFVIHNALYWIGEFRFDGLRMDAVDRIVDDSTPHLLEELTSTVRARLGDERPLHLVLENDRNDAHLLQRDAGGAPAYATAQWNDDFHHALHLVVTGESDGYYRDYADAPLERLGRCLAEGFAYQGEPSPYRDGEPRGTPSSGLPPTAFVSFLQNHDQVGNRAYGERIDRLADARALRLATACLLLAPSPPLLFMGQEFMASSPFQFFCDFGAELAQAVTTGRRREFGRFERFRDPAAQASIPDPNAEATFAASKLRWGEVEVPPHRDWLAFHRDCLALRREHVTPRVPRIARGGIHAVDGDAVAIRWPLDGGGLLAMSARFGDGASPVAGTLLCKVAAEGDAAEDRELSPWSLVLALEDGR